MGGGYSDLNIYFKSVKPKYSGDGYTVTANQENFKECSDFQIITHSIEITNPSNNLSYNILLYDGSNEDYKGEYVFGYYYPKNDNEVIETVSIYYSVLAPNDPLVISFKTRGSITYNCLPSILKDARWDRAYNISEYSFKPVLSKGILDDEYRKISHNQKIRFKLGNNSKDISGLRQILDKDYFRFIYRPGGTNSILGCTHLFSLDTVNGKTPNATNQLNDYYLLQMEGKLYDGIMVYYEHKNSGNYKYGMENALLLEFIETSKVKVQLKKKDKAGCWWCIDKIDYNGDSKLIAELKNIKSQAIDQVVAIILDMKKGNNNGDKIDKEDSNNAYNKYTHSFSKEEKPIFLFEREIKTFEGSETVKTKKVEVYYLKTKSGDDIEPFLIVVYHNSVKTKAYHFSNQYKFQDWKLCSEVFKIEEKLQKVEKYASCIPILGLLRWYTHQILIGKEPTDEEIKQEETNQRPEVHPPKTKAEGPPIQWIIVGSVGGGVFVISSAALYGVYWYNTTIKLLT